MKAVRFASFGAPLLVAQVVDDEPGPLSEGEALVEVLATPINPSDVLTLQGLYGALPKLPAVPGNEGVGRVVQVAGSDAVKQGDLVFLPLGAGTWRTHVKAKASALERAPAGADLLQLAMLSVDPPTAERMLREFVQLEPGEFVLQNAANSAVGRYVIELAKLHGWKTINVVRRAELMDELTRLGGDVVLVDGDDLPRRVRQASGGKVRLAFDAVGGAATQRLGDSLSPGGVVVNYGIMSGDGPRLSPGAAVFKGISLHGFWLVRSMRNLPGGMPHHILAHLAQLIAEGKLRAAIDRTYPLEEIHAALARAMEGGRDGKVLLTPNGPVS